MLIELLQFSSSWFVKNGVVADLVLLTAKESKYVSQKFCLLSKLAFEFSNELALASIK